MEFEKIGNDWDEIIGAEFEKPYFKVLQNFLDDEYAKEIVYPPQKDIFKAFRLTSYAETRVVILGQDPYPNPGEAHGLAFSVPQGVELPNCLRNIYNEIVAEFPEGSCDRQDGCLDRWAEQGVLLLNTVLTVRKGKPGSHFNKGWEEFTGAVLRKLSQRPKCVIFMLWGRKAQSDFALKVSNLDSYHFVLEAPHPAAIPKPKKNIKDFIGCGHFKIANDIIIKNELEPVDWQKQKN